MSAGLNEHGYVSRYFFCSYTKHRNNTRESERHGGRGGGGGEGEIGGESECVVPPVPMATKSPGVGDQTFQSLRQVANDRIFYLFLFQSLSLSLSLSIFLSFPLWDLSKMQRTTSHSILVHALQRQIGCFLI